jgi:hypothetical protein
MSKYLLFALALAASLVSSELVAESRELGGYGSYEGDEDSGSGMGGIFNPGDDGECFDTGTFTNPAGCACDCECCVDDYVPVPYEDDDSGSGKGGMMMGGMSGKGGMMSGKGGKGKGKGHRQLMMGGMMGGMSGKGSGKGGYDLEPIFACECACACAPPPPPPSPTPSPPSGKGGMMMGGMMSGKGGKGGKGSSDDDDSSSGKGSI